jgi:predicted lipoprotein with Yx(FWY)xxD motif
VGLRLGVTPYGRALFDGTGRVLYLFDADRGGTSTCYGACATAWPPYLVEQSPIAAPELDQGLVSTASRSDGSRQVTYNRHPLYYYVGDANPGQVKCQGAVEYGGGWFVVDGRGNAVTRT